MSISNKIFKKKISSDTEPPIVGEKFESLTDKYNVTSQSYPLDLFSPDGRYGGNYVVFYINSQSSSRFLDKKSKNYYDDSELGISDTNHKSSSINQVLSNDSSTIERAVTAGAGGYVVGKIASVAAKTVGLDLPLGSISAVTAAVIAASGVRETKRLKTAIALPVANDLSNRYSMNWAEESSLAFDVALNVGKDLGDALTNAANLKSPMGALKSLTNNALGVIQSAAISAVGGASAFTGKAANPKKEQTFNGVDFRSVFFNYRFAPRSKAEYENIQEIIYQLKFHMHPEYSKSNYIFIYPSEFDIVYYQNGTENPHLPKLTSCVLREVVVNYSPNSKFTTFEEGIPSEINMTLSFVELGTLTKTEIENKDRKTKATY